jgi:hypothetical protein
MDTVSAGDRRSAHAAAPRPESVARNLGCPRPFARRSWHGPDTSVNARRTSLPSFCHLCLGALGGSRTVTRQPARPLEQNKLSPHDAQTGHPPQQWSASSQTPARRAWPGPQPAVDAPPATEENHSHTPAAGHNSHLQCAPRHRQHQTANAPTGPRQPPHTPARAVRAQVAGSNPARRASRTGRSAAISIMRATIVMRHAPGGVPRSCQVGHRRPSVSRPCATWSGPPSRPRRRTCAAAHRWSAGRSARPGYWHGPSAPSTRADSHPHRRAGKLVRYQGCLNACCRHARIGRSGRVMRRLGQAASRSQVLRRQGCSGVEKAILATTAP